MQHLRNSVGAGKKLLLISSAGGHIAELWRIERELGVNPDSIWVTSRNPQTESLLKGRRVQWVPYVSPRDVIGSLRVARVTKSLIRDEHFDGCISSGAAIAAFSLPSIAMQKVRTIYVESLTRVVAPSVTGRIARTAPSVETWSQHSGFESPGWRYSGSVLDSYAIYLQEFERERIRLFVTLGTIRPYRFDRAVDIVLNLLENAGNIDVVWQLGATTRSDLPGEVYLDMSGEEMQRHMLNTDVIIGHAGVGTVLDALECGISPIVIPRSKQLSEHVDSHQVEFAEELSCLGTALTVMPGEDLSYSTLLLAASRKARLQSDSDVE